MAKRTAARGRSPAPKVAAKKGRGSQARSPGRGRSAAWPFSEAPDTAVITLKRILMGESFILHVMHDAEDGYWQFLDGGDVEESDAALVPFEELVGFDPTLAELAKLPLGWMATRAAVGGKWKQEAQPAAWED